jgi:hypothetical protein
MSSTHCHNCGAEVLPPEPGLNPKYCRRCGWFLTLDEDLQPFPSDEDDLGRGYSLYNYEDLGELINDAVPENHPTLTPTRLKTHIVQTIWERITGINPRPYDQSLDCEGREQAMLKCIAEGTPPSLALPQSMSAHPSQHPVRHYHLVWVNGFISPTHPGLTAKEAEDMRSWVAKFYYHLKPCDCEK